MRQIGLVVADDLVFELLVGVLVDDGHGRAELHRFAREFRDVDHLRAREQVLKLQHAAFDESLTLFRGVILRVLGQIAMRALPRWRE